MKIIKLTKNKETIVDDEDYNRLIIHSWCLSTSNYAKRGEYINGKNYTVSMHREILGLAHGDGKLVDHINRNKLDNQKHNLRIADKSINAYNSKIRIDNSSQYRGVHYHKQKGKWQARICKNGKRISCGLFDSPADAAIAYNNFYFKINGGLNNVE